MPTTVSEAFAAAGLSPGGSVPWGTKPALPERGVYIVSLTDSLDSLQGALPRAPLSPTAFEQWLSVCPELTVDGARPPLEQLIQRVAAFWLPDEVVLYVGLAESQSLSDRLGQYYQTPLGKRTPHAGGYFLKLLSNLHGLWVHYAASANPTHAESVIIGLFSSNVSDTAKRDLKDPVHPFPFANLEWPRGVRKVHGLRGATERRANQPKSTTRTKNHASRSGHTSPSRSLFDRAVTAIAPQGNYASCKAQRVTAKNLSRGQIRIPSTGVSSAKSLFPASRSAVRVVLRGSLLRASWDPRIGPDRERSGVLRVGAILRDLVGENEVLIVTERIDGAISID
ncbi:hypothetical protein SAMN05445850_8571 [Paraburkholderia tuberum]|uniref:Uncharacterized protein n=1 Tax=Paraburkholderia tuberum TaxID=157910 RepID=A0A1H1KL14_9BURK|nr:hypothetical protein SAMN05445850_8571 [Paraburkholderia tuberum]